jgi:lambda family phage tail tape measure protein
VYMANQRYVLEFSLKDVGSTLKAGKKDADAFRGSLDSIIKATDKAKNSSKGGWKNAMMGGDAYDVARGSAGATGASGRDFANQARGLDGLVRLYATYAANLFAAGAAFRALSNAADTSNMVQGMNQLGAASGLALGSIAKNLVTATDGAISMREAMEATTKGTAAGLTAKQMEQLGQVANKASKALGIAMPDAISRLTRGISKLEPELLDELGLFTKIGPATDDYARSIGKAASQLSDFERRQAFANAVLKEGNDKFNAIDIPANPYDKLLASLKNLSFVALELTNKVLVPFVNLLSQSPGALLAILTAIGATIVKSAIPALGHFRENLKRTAETSRQAFSQMYNNQQEAFSNLAADQGAMAERTFRNSKDIKSKLEKLQKEGSTFTKGKKIDYAALAGKDPFSLTDTELKSLDARAKYLATKNAEEADRLRKHVANLRAIRDQSTKIGDVASSKTIEGSEKWWSTAFANDRINKDKLSTLASQTIRSNVAETQSLLGMRAAWQKLSQDVDAAQKGFLKVQTGVDAAGNAIMTTAPKMGRLDGFIVKSAASAGMLVQKLGTTISAFGHIGITIGAAVAAFGIFDSFITKTAKEAAAFNLALDNSTEAVANVDRTINALRKQPGIATASIQGFLALSNSSQTVTDSIITQIQATKDLLKAISDSKWDSFTNKIAGLFNQDVASKSAKSLATTVQSQLKVFREAGMGDEANAAFKIAIGVQSLDLETLTDRFKTSTDAQDKFEKSAKILSNRLGETNSKLQEFKTSTEAVSKAYDEFVQSTANTNPLFKIGEALQNLSVSMQSVATQGIDAINAAFNQFANNPKSIAQFGPEFVQQFVNIRKEFQTTLTEATKFKQDLNKINEEIDKNKKAVEDAKQNFFFEGRFTAERSGAEENLARLEDEKKKIQELQVKLDTKSFLQASQLFKIGAEGAFKNGAEYIEKALGDASKKAALTIAQATVSALSGEEAARRSGQLKDREIQLQIDQIDTTINLIKSNTELETTIAETNARMALADAKASGKSPEVISILQAQADAMGVFKGILANSKGRINPESIPGYNSPRAEDANNPQTPFIKQQVSKYNSLVAAQEATRIAKMAEKTANALDTEQKANLGRLANQKQLAAVNDSILQQDIARQDILASINTLNATENLAKKQKLENEIQDSKFTLERAGYEVAIKNAMLDRSAQGKKEVEKQQELLKKVTERQDKEKDNKGVENRIKLKAQELQQSISLNALNDAILDQDIARLGIVSSLIGFSSEQNVLATSALENEKLQNKFALERKKIEDDIASLKSDTSADAKSIALAEANLQLVITRQEKEKDNKGLQDAVKLLEARFDLEQKLAGFRKTAADAQGQQAEDELNYKKELGLVTGEQYAKEKANLDRARVGRESALEQANIDNLIAKKNLAQEGIDKIVAGGDIATPAAYQNIADLNSVIDAQAAALQATNAQKLNSIDLNEKLASKMTGYSKIVEGAFENMADALAEFARTGKLDFKSLVDQMLMDLIRFEMRAQMSSLYKGFGGLSGMLSMFTTISGAGTLDVTQAAARGYTGMAKGGAYDAGLRTFAKGGMFTNSIVSQPTLFKFAKGTGLMGEAGPEAIMPLKRDSNGNLGVRAGGNQGNVDVVVNNFGSERATTRETTDSRGNRKIEVIIGDMVASEVSRVGSPVQQSISSNFNNKPALVRR